MPKEVFDCSFHEKCASGQLLGYESYIISKRKLAYI